MPQSLDRAIKAAAGSAKRNLAVQRRVAQVTSITDRETTGFVACDTYQVSVHDIVDLGVDDLIIIEQDPVNHKTFRFVDFYKGGGVGNNDSGDPIPWVYTPGVTSPPGEDLTLTPASGQELVLPDGMGWPFENVLSVSSTKTAADYTTLSAAVAGASAGDIIFLDAETHTCDNVTIPANVTVVGFDRDNTTLQTTSQANVVTLSDGSRLVGLTLKNNQAAAGAIYGTNGPGTGNTAELLDCDIIVTNTQGSGGPGAYGTVGDGLVTLINCDITTSVAVAGGYSAAVYANTGSGTKREVYGGSLNAGTTGTTWEAYAVGSTVIALFGPKMASETTSGTVNGYFSVDDASAQRPAMWVSGVDQTVGTGKDHTTIQDAIDWFKGKIIVGSCTITVDADDYDEAVNFSDLFLAADGALELVGDTKALAGISYVDGADCNQNGITNGGDGVVTLATNGARDEITVTMATTNPDFDADGWGSGDDILVYADDGNSYERIINSISPGGAGNNVIEITVALPAGATLGNDGTAICLLADRTITRTSAGECIVVNGVRGVKIDGFHLETSTGAACHALHVKGGGRAICENVSTDQEDVGFRVDGKSGSIQANDGACSAWNGSRGAMASDNGEIDIQYGVAVNCTIGMYSNLRSYVRNNDGISVNCTTAYQADTQSMLYASAATARQNTTGYYARYGSFIQAANTSTTNNGNGTDYNPAVGVPGSAQGNHYGVIYAT